MVSDFDLSPIASDTVSVGDIFGRLYVLSIGRDKKSGRRVAVCKCSCGSVEKIIRLDSLTSRRTVSCGCFHKEASSTHLMTNNRHYKRWWGMIDRCTNEKNPSYDRYGGRGIKVCERWRDIRNYLSDLPDGYFEGAEIDRIDNNGDYEPGNVRWATASQNCDNRRTRHSIEFLGVTKSLMAWSRDIGISETSLRERLFVRNWPIEKALTTPPIRNSEAGKNGCDARWRGHTAKRKPVPRHITVKRFEYLGKQMSIRDLSDETGISIDLLRKRLCERNWPIEKAVKKPKR